MDLKLPFGLKNGQLVQVSDVESGLKCDCICPACQHPLIARKGKRKIHHFSHYKHPQCEHAFETSLHMAAKEVIKKAGYILLPELQPEIVAPRERLLFEKIQFHFDAIHLERRFNDIVPDVVLEKDDAKLCIEIYVTHKVDEEKIKKIKDSKLSTIEIDLSEIDRFIDFAALNEMVVNSIKNKKWLFNSELYNLQKEILENSIIRKTKGYGFVDHCPRFSRSWRGKPAAHIINCNGCIHQLYIEKKDGEDDKTISNGDERVVYCFGHKTDEEINKLLSTKSKKADNKSVYTQRMNPFCHSCGQWMILKKATRGPNAGSEFWGCRNYPYCNFALSGS